MLSGITSVTIDGVATTDYSFQANGLLTVYDASISGRRDVIEVIYTAGVTASDVLKELVSDMVTLKLAKSYGVTSEAAGGVSITYNSSWTNGSYDRVLENNAAMLHPYRLEGVF
jgi:hypothetical protein